jgi:hypothetical protein
MYKDVSHFEIQLSTNRCLITDFIDDRKRVGGCGELSVSLRKSFIQNRVVGAENLPATGAAATPRAMMASHSMAVINFIVKILK